MHLDRVSSASWMCHNCKTIYPNSIQTCPSCSYEGINVANATSAGSIPPIVADDQQDDEHLSIQGHA